MSSGTTELPAPPGGNAGREAVARALRAELLKLHNALGELDRQVEPEQVEQQLWAACMARRLRCLLLQERGRALHAERAHGFPNFEGDKEARLKKVVVPFDADGLFAACAGEQMAYSGPRPPRGFPVDLVLVMGRRRPVWCLVVPLPFRNRWGRFLYVDAGGDQLGDILLVDALARAAVHQMRAGRYQRHRPVEKLRVFRDEALMEQLRRKGAIPPARGGGADEPGEGPPDGGDGGEEATGGGLEALMRRKGRKGPASFDFLAHPPEAERFDGQGRLVTPLDPAEMQRRLGKFPAMPLVASQVLGLLDDPDASVQQIQELIAGDAALSLRLLQVANSSLYASMRECETIGEAVVRLGFATIRSWLLATATQSAFLSEKPSGELRLLYRQSVLCALAAKSAARLSRAHDPESAFVAGLMQNIGQLLLAQNHPRTFTHIHQRCVEEGRPYHEVERELLAFDHADASGLVLARWGLAQEQVAAVGVHHGPVQGQSPLADLVAVAEELALRSEHGPLPGAGEGPWLEADALERLGLGEAAQAELLDEVRRAAHDRSLLD